MNTKAVLFISHIVDAYTINSFRKLSSELSAYGYDIIWAIQGHGLILDKSLPPNNSLYRFDLKDLKDLGYSLLNSKNVLGNINYILLGFFKRYPNYDKYWAVEYDVYFTGNWYNLFSTIEKYNYGLASCHIEFFEKGKNDDWYWWKSIHLINQGGKECRYVKSFNPIFCLSHDAVVFLDKSMKLGHRGHYEVLMPTLLYNNGFDLLDIGGTGCFTPYELRNKFYIQGKGVNNGTMRYRPEFLKEEILALDLKDRLFHPLKSDAIYP